MHKVLLITALMAALLSGCERQPPAPVMPEVNEANCKTAKIMEIKDKEMQKAFATNCATRTTFVPTKNALDWLELLKQTTPKDQETNP